jgi:hypothetical protein
MNSPSKACVSLWSYDAFASLVGQRFSAVGPEQLSRINALLEALLLFDRTVLPDTYVAAHRTLVEEIDPAGEIFETLPADALRHAGTKPTKPSRDTLDVCERDAQALREDCLAWFRGNGDGTQANAAASAFGLMRQWQWNACKEVGETSGATLLMPLSLRDMEIPVTRKDELRRALDARLPRASDEAVEILFPAEPRFADHLTAMPPVLSLFVSRHRSRRGIGETLRELREELAEARRLREQLEAALRRPLAERNRAAAVSDFNRNWQTACTLAADGPALLSADIVCARVVRARFDFPATTGNAEIARSLYQAASSGTLPARDRIKAYTRLFDREGRLLLGDDFLPALEAGFGVREYQRAQA